MEEIEEIRNLKESISFCKAEIEELENETGNLNQEYKKVKLNGQYLKSFSVSRNKAFEQLENLQSNIFSSLNSAKDTLESCTARLQFFHNLKISLAVRPNQLKIEVFTKKKHLPTINEGISKLQSEIHSINQSVNDLMQQERLLNSECYDLSNQKNMKIECFEGIIQKVERLRKELNENSNQLASFPKLKKTENETTVKRKQKIQIRNKPKIYSDQTSEADTEDSVTNPESKFYTIQDKSDDLIRQKSLLLIDQARMRNEIRMLQSLNYSRKVIGNLNSKQESHLLFKYFVFSAIICLSILSLY